MIAEISELTVVAITIGTYTPAENSPTRKRNVATSERLTSYWTVCDELVANAAAQGQWSERQVSKRFARPVYPRQETSLAMSGLAAFGLSDLNSSQRRSQQSTQGGPAT